ncbi:Multiple antibiotic resistance protein marA [Serratia marcescens]|uniref:Multiple antibiotic resistance protein marA n=1 Tax=Serratia marcescens TaxID=615 RepID=A0A379ZZH5_SERMA|nr:Multiple antibiotic resistance protein marA [Serratia marcescens]
MCIGQRVTLPNDGSICMNTTGFITDLKAWIDNNLEEKLDINTVADRAGYSKWHLQRMFKRQTGYALGEYIRMQKLKVSAERLANSGEPIGQRGDLARLRLTAVVQPQLQTPVRPNAGRLAPRAGAASVGEMHAPLNGWAVGIKKPEFAFGLFLYGGEGGIDSLRSPCGPPLAVQIAGVLSNPVEGSHPPGWCAMHTKKPELSLRLSR